MEFSRSGGQRQPSHVALQARVVPVRIGLIALVTIAGLVLPANVHATEVEVSETPLTSEEWTPPCSPECEVVIAPEESEALGIEEYEGGAPGGGLTPQELQDAYNLPEHGGSSSTIVVVDGPSDPTAEADMNAYRKYFGLPECTKTSGCFRQVNERGEPSEPKSAGGWAIEISLDIDMVSAACPECHITLIEAKEERLARAEANDEAVKLGATAVSNSWNYGFEKGNSANSGVTCFGGNCITAEEEASYESHFNHPGTPILFSGGDYGYAVRYPTISPNVIAVGGTALKKEVGSSRGWAETVWSNSAFGIDQKGRGTGSGCSIYESKPKWESDSGCAKRIENDIAADADPRTGVAVYYAGGFLAPVGGTSASAPFIAGVEGLSSSSVRSMGAEAMWLAGSAKSLFDITEGSNGTCTPPAEDAYWCTAGVGYDGPSGNGVPNGVIAVGQPTVSGVLPGEGPEAGGTSVTISGTNFEGVTAVNFGATAASSFTVKSSTTIEATSPAHAAGTVDVTVTTAKGTSAIGSGDHFTYLAKPTVTNVQPNTGPKAGGTTVIISGTGFTNATEVSFEGVSATSFSVLSATSISAVSPAGSGSVFITVTTPAGTSTVTFAGRFNYRSGTAFGWGDNSTGELGDGTASGPESCSSEPCATLPVSAGSFSSEVTTISAGVDHSLALLSNGTVMAWGGDSEGEMCTTSASSSPVSVSELSEVGAVSAGGYDTLALLKDGTVRACGRNFYGELGNGTTTNSKTPVKVSGLSEVVAVSAGETHSLALLKNGKIMAWGQGSAGELGNGTTTSSSVPVEVSGITEAVAISAGGEYSLALLKSGKVMAWGSGASGKLGNGGTTNSTTPVEVSGLSEVTAISAGGAHALALQESGTVQSWGANQSGQLGTGGCCEFSKVPVKVSGITEATAVSAGFHSLAMLRSGAVMDWGRDSQGQLGVGSYTGPETCEFEGSPRSCSKVPVTVSGLTKAVGIEGGVNFALSLDSTPSFTQTIDSGHSLNVVACVPGTTDCVAGDSPGNAFYAEKASATGSATWKSWTGPGVGASHALACPTTTLCLLAAGEQENGGNLYYATTLGGSWSLAYGPVYGVHTISCPSTSFCVDGQDGQGYFRYSTTPGSSSWTLEQQGSNSMNGVSCLSSSFCGMVDSAGNLYVATSTTQIESSSWTLTNVDGSNALNGVACTSTTSCLAVDGIGNVLKLAISGGGTATTTKLNIDSTNSLTGITCTTGSTCAAVDNVGNVFVSTNSGGNWTKQYSIGTKQTGVSCASVSLCVATGSTGAVTTFNPR
jgi:alpha-tubulin suppressor-like RCC1 family protein